jgi:hypothetical protein
MKNKNLTKRLLNYSAGAAALLGVSATADAQYIAADIVERDKLVDPKNGMNVPDEPDFGPRGPLTATNPYSSKYDFAGIDVDNDGITDFYVMGFHNGYSWSANSRYSYQEFILSPYNYATSSFSSTNRDKIALFWTEFYGDGSVQGNGQLNTPFRFPPILAKKFQNNETIPNIAQMSTLGSNSTLSPYPFAFIGYDYNNVYSNPSLNRRLGTNFLGGAIGNIGFNLLTNLPRPTAPPLVSCNYCRNQSHSQAIHLQVGCRLTLI